MGQIKNAIEYSKTINGYSLKDIIGAVRAMTLKLKKLRETIFEKTGILINEDGKILVNPQMEHITDIVSTEEYKKHPELLRIDLHSDPEIYYDIYTINENHEIIPVHLNAYNSKKDKENRQFIEKYKHILYDYFDAYYEYKKQYIYPVKNTNLQIKISGDNVVLYNDGFFINFWENDKLRIDYYGKNIDEDCKEIYDLNINKVLSGIKIDGYIPSFISSNVSPISIMVDKPNPEFPNALCYKVTDYSLMNEMFLQINEEKRKKQFSSNEQNKMI